MKPKSLRYPKYGKYLPSNPSQHLKIAIVSRPILKAIKFFISSSFLMPDRVSYPACELRCYFSSLIVAVGSVFDNTTGSIPASLRIDL